jgi:cytochrome c peroxidase
MARNLPRATLTLALVTALFAPTGCAKAEEHHEEETRRAIKGAPKQHSGGAKAVDKEALLAKAKLQFAALPEVMPPQAYELDDAKIDLGRSLYFDPRLSKNHDVSCQSCHKLEAYGVDNLPTSPGHKGQLGGRNSPTVYNAGLHMAQFWDGRAADLEAQAKGPILNPIEMAMPDEASVVKVVESIPGYVELHEKAFPGKPLGYDTITTAIAAFERKLVTPSPFDRFLGGDLEALTNEQAAGLAKYMEVGCPTCHTGVAVGGSMYQKLGVNKPYPTKDEGRFAVTKLESDKFVFKVPSLRNVAKTGPYLHDGSITDLTEMVKIMAEVQTTHGVLSDEDAKSIVTFLEALTGELPTDYIAAPKLPESGPNTPKPDPA